jgi:dedicated sortase system histidine kinase
MRIWPTIKLKLRSKLLLISLVLLLLPWLGVRYIQAMEDLLQQQQAQSMATVAKAGAILIAQHPDILFERVELLENKTRVGKITVSTLSEPAVIDGYQNEWTDLRGLMQNFPVTNQLLHGTKIDPQDVSARYLWAKQQRSLLLLLDVVDDSVVFRNPRIQNRHGGDAIILAVVDKQQRVRRYFLSASAPGKMNAFEYIGSYLDPVIIGRQHAIKAAWQLSLYGYRLELTLPEPMIDSSIAIAVIDVDKTDMIPQVIGVGDVRDSAFFADVLLPSTQLGVVLSEMATKGTRLWLIDNAHNIIASAGQGEVVVDEQQLNSFTDFFYSLFLDQTVSDDESLHHQQAIFEGGAVQGAMKGHAATERRQRTDLEQTVVVAAHPVLLKGVNMGVVVAEKNTNSILGLQNKALKTLLNTSLWVMAIAMIVLIAFASRLSFRIRRLNSDVSAVVNGEGRVSGVLAQRVEYDELGELRQGFESLFERLGLYTHYLEALSSRLTHELRTPVAVIRTSLEHLEQSPDNSQVYIDRARSGSERLNNIIARMSEASRLEQTVNNVVLEVFNLTTLLSDIAPVYQDLHPQIAFEFNLAEHAINIKGSQELIVQMFDKLIANAVDFHHPETTIVVSFEESQEHNRAVITIKNSGNSLPENMEKQLFQPMVSIREAVTQSTVPHLGLGLYIVKLVVQQHGGHVVAQNWQQGVEFRVELPIT